jgi:hypothetical protein
MRGLLVALLVLVAAPAAADCPDWLTADMADRGVPAFEIARMCGPPATRTIAPQAEAAAMPPAAGAAQRQSNRCVPASGPFCATPSLRRIGSPCWCGREAGGFAEGTIR